MFSFCSTILAKENAARVRLCRGRSAHRVLASVHDLRAARRLARFEREQLIVDYPNRGVSVARIAARVGVGEKRMRAVICDPRTGIRGLARRTPHPPEEFVAIQVGRLNEALLVAYSAMTGANLKAVDRVVKIVRELDRYHGFVTAERRLPEAPAGGTMAFGAALVCRPEFATQGPEDIGFEWTAPLPLSPPLKRGEGWGEGLGDRPLRLIARPLILTFSPERREATFLGGRRAPGKSGARL